MSVLACLVLLSACGNKQEVSYKSGGMTQTVAEGQGSIPANFPLPIYPQASPTGSVSAQGQKGDEDSMFLILSTTDDINKVSDYYQKAFKADAWKLENSQTSPELVSLSVTKGNHDGSVTLSTDDSKKSTTISLAVSRIDESMQPADAESFSVNKLTPPTD